MSSRSSTPAFYTVAADGSILFDFSGHIHADGVDLWAGTSTSPPNDNRVRWLLQSDGSLVADVSAFHANYGADIASLVEIHAHNDTFPVAANEVGVARLTASGRASAFNGIEVFSNLTGGPTHNFVRAFIGSLSRTIIDQSSQSDFLQAHVDGLGALANIRASFNWTNMTWNAGANFSNVLAVTHDLGVVPKMVVPSIDANLIGVAASVNAYNFTAAGFNVQGYTPFAPGVFTVVPLGLIAVAAP